MSDPGYFRINGWNFTPTLSRLDIGYVVAGEKLLGGPKTIGVDESRMRLNIRTFAQASIE